MKRNRAYRRHHARRTEKNLKRRLKQLGRKNLPDREIGKILGRHGDECHSRSCRKEATRLKKIAHRQMRHQGHEIERRERH